MISLPPLQIPFGLFSVFSKGKKDVLDQGVAKTKESVFQKLARATFGKSTIDDDVLDNLEEVLITSDVGVETTLKIIKRIQARVSRDKYTSTSELNHILRDEITQLLLENDDFVTDQLLKFVESAFTFTRAEIPHGNEG